MKRIGNAKLFMGAVVVGLVSILALAAFERPAPPEPAVKLNKLVDGVFVAEQLQVNEVAAVKQQGIAVIVDLRPDGEAPDQPAHTAVAAEAQRLGMRFDYIPVPHGDIPPAAVTELGHAIAQADQPTLLYCRSGRRAARTWALAEASRANGRDARAILTAVRGSGQSADDLQAEIERRIAARTGKS